MSSRIFSYLALGDSYTIGEGVPAADSFPYQTVQGLKKTGVPFSDPQIVAKTGWTTGELREGIAAHFPEPPQPVYDVVSLLIGVNNEYRGRSLAEYAAEFEQLLLQAIGFAGGLATHTFVLSIPDWSVTPFAQANLPDKLGRDQVMIAGEIDAFNEVASRIAGQYQVDFIDITPHTRARPEAPGSSTLVSPVLSQDGWLTTDLLHPSGREYGYWAGLLADRIGERIAQ